MSTTKPLLTATATGNLAAHALDFNSRVGTHDIIWVTLDTLRYDVAQRCFEAGETPHFRRLLGPFGWQLRHSPGSFTYAAHRAFFAGFLPTCPMSGGSGGSGGPKRRMAVAFEGSESIDASTAVLEGASIVEGLRGRGYRTTCLGGVGFFNLKNPLGSDLPSLFEHARWENRFGVTDRESTRYQVDVACDILGQDGLHFLFINISALHQPNCHYLEGRERDDRDTQAAALRYVDGALAPLWSRASNRPCYVFIMSDHGTAYGDDGLWGHRCAHPCVWQVPYAEFELGVTR